MHSTPATAKTKIHDNAPCLIWYTPLQPSWCCCHLRQVRRLSFRELSITTTELGHWGACRRALDDASIFPLAFAMIELSIYYNEEHITSSRMPCLIGFPFNFKSIACFSRTSLRWPPILTYFPSLYYFSSSALKPSLSTFTHAWRRPY